MGGFRRFFRHAAAASAITAGWVLLVALLVVPGTALAIGPADGPGPISSDTLITQPVTTLAAYGGQREHPPTPCSPLRHVTRTAECPPPLPGAEADAIRSPQQFAHRYADSRSPPRA